MLFLFNTLADRYPTKKARDLSEEFGKRWLRFGVGKEPWEEYTVQGTDDDGKIMIISGDNTWRVKSRKRDALESEETEEGPRRYEGWEAISEVLKKLASTERGVVGAEEAMWVWAAGGTLRLLGIEGTYGVVV